MGNLSFYNPDANAFINGDTITARTYDSTANTGPDALQKHSNEPPYVSNDYCLTLNGSDEYAYVADHADFDITGDLTIECLIRPSSVSGTRYIQDKVLAGTGYGLLQIDDEIRMQIDTAYEQTDALNMSTGTWYHIKATYDASAQEIKIYVNGSLEASSTTGVVPAAITANNERITIGATNAGASLFAGSIAWFAISAEEHDTAYNYLEKAGTNNRGYWEFQQDLTDSSGNSHTLTGNNLDASNYSQMTAYEVVYVAEATSGNKDTLIIEKNHNLTSSASIRLFSGDWTSASTASTLLATIAVTADTTIINNFGSTAITNFWVEVHDPTNTDSYIKIRYAFLGEEIALTADLSETSVQFNSNGRAVVSNANPIGNIRSYTLSKPRKIITGTLRTFVGNEKSSGDDYSKLDAFLKVASEMKPAFFTFSSVAAYEPYYTYLGYFTEANTATYNMQTMGTSSDDETWDYGIAFTEAGVEA